MNGKTFAKKIRGSVTGWLFLLPMTFGICVFTLLPIAQSLWYSFYDYDVVSKFDFVGFGNYVKVFRDPVMGKVVGNTLLFAVVNIPVVMVGSYLLALLLNTDVKGVKAFRVIYYLPCVMPAIVGGIVWSYVMRYDVTAENPGFFNTILLSLGLDQFKFFYAESSAAILSHSFHESVEFRRRRKSYGWRNSKIYRSNFTEAASIDGAGSVISFFKITLPLSTPMIFYNLITTFIVTLQFNGTLTFAPNQGFGYNNSVFMFGLKIYDEAFRRYNMGIRVRSRLAARRGGGALHDRRVQNG